MRHDFAHYGKFVGGVFFQRESLKAEESRKRGKQHHARDQHDHESDLLSDRSVAQVMQLEPRCPISGVEQLFSSRAERISQNANGFHKRATYLSRYLLKRGG